MAGGLLFDILIAIVERAGNSEMLGEQIRKLRQGRGYSVRRLAHLAGVSVGLISQVERGITDPSLQTLRALSKALDAPLFDLFQPPTAGEVVVVRTDHRASVGGAGGSVMYQRLSGGSGRLEVLEGILAPGTSSSLEPWSHPSEECVTVLEGILDVVVGGQVHRLHPGDSSHFDSRVPHRYVNQSDAPARFHLAITPPSY